MRLSYQYVILTGVLAVALLVLTKVQAKPVNPIPLEQRPTLNPKNPKKQLNRVLVFAAPPPPAGIEKPGQRSDAGSRGDCEDINKQLNQSQEKPLTALVPVYGFPDSELVYGATTASHPTFWFYVPYSPPFTAEFVLQDEAQQTIYQAPVSLSGSIGVVSFPLPSTASQLKIGERYRWYFNVYCQPEEPPVYVSGWVQRVALSPALSSRLQKATLRERVALYASQGFWYDALTASAELRRNNPKDADWFALLQTVDLSNIASEPITAVRLSKN